MSAPGPAAPFARATSFLRWSFDNPPDADCAEALQKHYAAYCEDLGSIDYVWEHVERRASILGAAGRQGARVLEVGCGIGSNCLWAAVNGGSLTGIEVRGWDVEIASRRQRHLEAVLGRRLDCRFLRANALDFGDRDGYDLVFLQEAFHHLEPRGAAVSRLASLVGPGGRLVLQETNAWNPLIQARLLRRRGFRTVVARREPTTGQAYTYGNERIITPWALDRLFRPLGFVTHATYFRLRRRGWRAYGSSRASPERSSAEWDRGRPGDRSTSSTSGSATGGHRNPGLLHGEALISRKPS
ncbi:MAG TPA: class I SAM-dependent methyltransferase [Candidatus Eisenbacteria bacterium]